MYKIYDTQQGEYLEAKFTEKEVREYALSLLYDRYKHMQDEYGKECKDIVDKGLSNFSLKQAEQVLTDWEYRLEK